MKMHNHKGPAGEYYSCREGYRIVQWNFIGLYEVTGPNDERLGSYSTAAEAIRACDDHLACINGEWVI